MIIAPTETADEDRRGALLVSRTTNVLPVVLVVIAAGYAALPPLHEMDLAQHLAMGEWIVQQRAVPFTEPFAWTREGQSYFAYSWLAQVMYYGLLRAFGPVGLHLLVGVLVGSSVAAAIWATRQLGFCRWAAFLIGVIHLGLMWGVSATLRPQQFLFFAVPIAWGLAGRIRAFGISPQRLLALTGIGALAANVHIFFPLTAVPIAYGLLAGGQARVWIPAAAAITVGWILNPYTLVLPDVFALNFGHNILLARPPSILEFVPGFEYAMQRPGVIIAAIFLLASPWIGDQPTARARERAVLAVFWVSGLVLFAYAGRLVVAWWMLAFPMAGAAAQRLVLVADVLRPAVRRVAAAAVTAIVFLVSAPEISPVFWLFEGNTVHRMLPRGGEDPALWLPSWLLCHTRAGAAGRIFTEFNYGTELNWRLPGYSPSIDGRTIFPDSVAIEFSFHPHGWRRVHPNTWTTADLALLERSFWLAPVLDQDTSWVLLAQGRRSSRTGEAALWAKRAWWVRWGLPTTLPALELRPGDPRGMCTATGVFPKGAIPP